MAGAQRAQRGGVWAGSNGFVAMFKAPNFYTDSLIRRGRGFGV